MKSKSHEVLIEGRTTRRGTSKLWYLPYILAFKKDNAVPMGYHTGVGCISTSIDVDLIAVVLRNIGLGCVLTGFGGSWATLDRVVKFVRAEEQLEVLTAVDMVIGGGG